MAKHRQRQRYNRPDLAAIMRALLRCERLDDRINPSSLFADIDHDHDHPEILDDSSGLCVYPPAPPPQAYNGGARGPMPQDTSVPAYASLPTANHTIYLDFNSHTTSGTSWNTNFTSGNPFNTPAFDINGNAADFNTEEKNRIRDIWKYVSEDYAPFNVNVTTVEPPVGDLIKSGGSDTRWGVRVCIGGTFSDWYGSSAGGVAYLTSFNYNSDTPCYVFADTQGDSVKSIAEAASHEVGHTLGLSHDGRITPAEGYYYGHGSGATGWAPIMGVGYNRQLVQWSKGEYTAANNGQDDLSIITTSNGFGYRTDDHGNTNAAATNLTGTTVVSAAGIITNSSDRDVFKFSAGGGSYAFTITPYELSPDLDIKAEIYNAAGTLVTTINPATALNATLSTSLGSGVYYLHILGTGYAGSGTGSPTDTGYTNYGSIGQYGVSITGAFGDPSTNAVSGKLYEDRNGNGLFDSVDTPLANATVYADGNGNSSFDSGETSTTTIADGGYVFNTLPNGTQSLRVALPGYAVTLPASGLQSVTLPVTGGAVNRDFALVRSGPGLYGRVYLDANANGLFDAGDSYLASRSVFLDTNANGNLDTPAEPSAVTDADGFYYLGGITGANLIRVVPGANLYPRNPASGAVTLTLSNNPSFNVDFGVGYQPVPLPTVTDVTINGGAAQRSRVRTLAIAFNSQITFAADAFTLRRVSDNLTLTSGTQITATSAVFNNATVVTLAFTGSTGVDFTSLADGVWQMKVAASAVANAFGNLGTDYLTPISGAGRIHRLFGDSSGDGTVSGGELLGLGNLFNSADPTFDFDNDNTISGGDLLQFGNRFGVTL